MRQTVLHLMVGLPGSGKTTLAREIEARTGAIRFTPDEWQLRLFRDDTDHPDHDWRHSEVEAIMWELGQRLLKAGVSVILDYGFWSREERRYYYDQARALGARFQVHGLMVPTAELLRRVTERKQVGGALAYTIEAHHMSEWAALFEPVTEDELREYADLQPEG